MRAAMVHQIGHPSRHSRPVRCLLRVMVSMRRRESSSLAIGPIVEGWRRCCRSCRRWWRLPDIGTLSRNATQDKKAKKKEKTILVKQARTCACQNVISPLARTCSASFLFMSAKDKRPSTHSHALQAEIDRRAEQKRSRRRVASEWHIDQSANAARPLRRWRLTAVQYASPS